MYVMTVQLPEMEINSLKKSDSNKTGFKSGSCWVPVLQNHVNGNSLRFALCVMCVACRGLNGKVAVTRPPYSWSS